MMCFMFFQFDFICICVCVSLSVCMFVRPNNNLVHNFIQSVQKLKKKKHIKVSLVGSSPRTLVAFK